MNRISKLAPPAGAAVLAILLVTPSSFAEERPENRTRREGITIERSATTNMRGSVRSTDNRRSSDAVKRDRSDDRRSAAARRDRDDDRRRERATVQRGDSRNDRARYERDRRQRENRDRYERDRRERDRRGRYERDRRDRHEYRRDQRRYYAHNGRISRVIRHGQGYRVWIHGAPHPFFVPLTHYHRDRFRVGVSIRLGGWFNPGGYYDYYDERSAGWIRGPVESVDYRRGTMVLRNDATGSFVTVDLRNRGRNIGRGDYIEVQGEWSRNGVFVARDIDVLEYGYIR